MNWEEQEADEVGFEFYRRAGFRDNEFFNMLYQLAITSGEVPKRDIVACMQKSFKTIALKKETFEPPRGSSTHPDYCWRIFDHQRELILHEKDYAPFPNNKAIISASGLANARAEIEADSRSTAPIFGTEDEPSSNPPDGGPTNPQQVPDTTTTDGNEENSP